MHMNLETAWHQSTLSLIGIRCRRDTALEAAGMAPTQPGRVPRISQLYMLQSASNFGSGILTRCRAKYVHSVTPRRAMERWPNSVIVAQSVRRVDDSITPPISRHNMMRFTSKLDSRLAKGCQPIFEQSLALILGMVSERMSVSRRPLDPAANNIRAGPKVERSNCKSAEAPGVSFVESPQHNFDYEKKEKPQGQQQ